MDLQAYHTHTQQALDHLHYLATMAGCFESWVNREDSKKSVPEGFAKHLYGLKTISEGRPLQDSPERAAMIRGARVNNSAPFTIGGAETGVSAHEAVIDLASHVVDLVPVRPLTFDLVLELAEFWLPSVLPEAKVVRAVGATLELEYVAATDGSVADASTEEDVSDSRLVALLGSTELEISKIADDTSKTVDEKTAEVLKLDRTSAGWTSSRWANVLNCSEQMIRKTDTWKRLRKAQKSAF